MSVLAQMPGQACFCGEPLPAYHISGHGNFLGCDRHPRLCHAPFCTSANFGLPGQRAKVFQSPEKWAKAVFQAVTGAMKFHLPHGLNDDNAVYYPT